MTKILVVGSANVDYTVALARLVDARRFSAMFLSRLCAGPAT